MFFYSVGVFSKKLWAYFSSGFLSVNASEKAFQDEKDSKLAEWRNKLAIIEALLAAKNDKFEGDEVDGGDTGLEIVAKQRREMEVCR